MSRCAIAAWASRTCAFDSANVLPPWCPHSARPRGREPGEGAFADQLPLELTLRRSSWPTWRERGLPACGALLGCGGLHSTFRERRYSQANFTAKRNATAINVGEHSPRRPAITLIKT